MSYHKGQGDGVSQLNSDELGGQHKTTNVSLYIC